MAEACLTCGHEHRHHSGLANMIDCDIPGCSCTKFEPADPKTEQTSDLQQAIHADAVYMVEQLQQQRNDWVTRASQYARERDDALEELARFQDVAGEETGSADRAEPGHESLEADRLADATSGPPPLLTPPDLHQAIHAATVALRNHHPAIGLSDPWAQPARIAVEAAAPVLLHVTRDRHAALEVHVAELRGALEQIRQLYLDLTAKGQLNFYVTKSYDVAMAALQTDGPARGHAILHEVQRLRTFKGDIRAALRPGRWRGFDGPDGVSKDQVVADVVGALTALDQAAQREVDR